MYNVIDLDIDLEIENFRRLESWFMERFNVCAKAYNVEINTVVCKESHSSNVHCYIKLKEHVDLRKWLGLQFCMGEDYTRFILTLERLQIYGYPQRFMFTYKVFENEIVRLRRNKRVCKE